MKKNKIIRKIIHIDMDYFFAQVEELDQPHLKDRPFAVGGAKSRRGILSTSNYVARKFGVKSAMPTFIAKQKCPELIILPSRFDRYRECSEKVFKIFREYTDIVEPISIDEAYLDVTHVEKCFNSATLMAREIKLKILKETGLTCSAGVSVNKLLAKICSELNKPDGLTLVRPEQVQDFIPSLEIKKINGVGAKMMEKMQRLNLNTFFDLQQVSRLDLQTHFGKFGDNLYNYCRGIDDREICTNWERKSLSIERTFSEDLIDVDEIKLKMIDCYDELIRRIERKEISADEIRSLFVKIKYANFEQTTIESQTLELNYLSFEELFLSRYLEKVESIRLIGMGIRLNTESTNEQLSLW